MSPIKNEPVLTAVTALVACSLALLVAFGVHLTDVQVLAVTQWVEAVYVVAVLVRSQVTPAAKDTHVSRVVAPSPAVPVDPVTGLPPTP